LVKIKDVLSIHKHHLLSLIIPNSIVIQPPLYNNLAVSLKKPIVIVF
jgi:hypothetical protein